MLRLAMTACQQTSLDLTKVVHILSETSQGLAKRRGGPRPKADYQERLGGGIAHPRKQPFKSPTYIVQGGPKNRFAAYFKESVLLHAGLCRLQAASSISQDDPAIRPQWLADDNARPRLDTSKSEQSSVASPHNIRMEHLL